MHAISYQEYVATAYVTKGGRQTNCNRLEVGLLTPTSVKVSFVYIHHGLLQLWSVVCVLWLFYP